jgi:hypothetical protein
MQRRELSLRCRCGQVRARAVEVAPDTTNRVVCYCHDCRAFARWLGREDLLDEAGGSEIVQMARGRVTIKHGLDRLSCVRLSDKGMFRWYASCCNTPIGNTVPSVPFIGVIGAFFDPEDERSRAEAFPRAVHIWTRSASGPVPPGSAPMLPMIVRVTRLVLTWKLRSLGGDTFFDPRNKTPRVLPRVLDHTERDALRDDRARALR